MTQINSWRFIFPFFLSPGVDGPSGWNHPGYIDVNRISIDFNQKSEGVDIISGLRHITTWNDQTYSQLKICWIRGVPSINFGLWDEHSSQYNLLRASKVAYPIKNIKTLYLGRARVKSESCNWDVRKHMGGWYTQDIPTSTNRTARQFEKWSEEVHLLYGHGMTSRFQPHLC